VFSAGHEVNFIVQINFVLQIVNVCHIKKETGSDVCLKL